MSWREVALIAGMALVTYACRYPAMALVSRITLSPGIVEALRFIPPVVLTAIIVPAVLAPQGRLALNLDNPALFATLVCGWVAWRRQNLLLTIVVGMSAWWGWQLILYLL